MKEYYIPIKAVQWNKHGDAKNVMSIPDELRDIIHFKCSKCNNLNKDHGYMQSNETPYFVCPGDYVIRDHTDDHYILNSITFNEIAIPKGD